jgi:hypothetical protein
MGTGDESGNWGVVTNLNLDMIGEAFGYGTENMGSDANTTITMADGAVDEARNLYLKITSTSLSATRTVTLAPNTVGKVWIIENATTNGQIITIKQGSGATINIPNGDVKMIATDGAGSGAAVYDLLVDLNIATKLTVKNPATSSSPATVLLQSGDTDVAAADVLGKIQFQAPDEGAGTDAILVAAEVAAISEGDFSSSNNATKLSFKTAASEAATEKMSLSSAGNLTLPTDAAAINFGADSDVSLAHNADLGLTLSAGANATTFTLTTTEGGASVAPTLILNRSSGSPAIDDQLGYINFIGYDSGGAQVSYSQIFANIVDPADGSEDGSLDIYCVTAGSVSSALKLTGGTATFSGSITVANGGNIGSTSTPTAIDIIGTGEIGIGNAGYTGAQTYIYDNTTGRIGLRLHLNNASSTQIGVYATTTGAGTAGYFLCSAAAAGVYGQAAAHYGLYGKTLDASYGGVIGYSGNGLHLGILGHGNTYGLYASSVYCVGAMYKGSGTFRISHPLKSEIEGEPWDLCHSFIEGPQCDLIYRGKVDLVDGQASINIDSHYDMTPGTFEWLTKADEVQTFTSNETGWDAVRSSFSGDTITIECQNSSSTDTISWMVIAERGDPNIIGSTITDDEGNLLIERPSEPEPPAPLPPGPPPSDP